MKKTPATKRLAPRDPARLNSCLIPMPLAPAVSPIHFLFSRDSKSRFIHLRGVGLDSLVEVDSGHCTRYNHFEPHGISAKDKLVYPWQAVKGSVVGISKHPLPARGSAHCCPHRGSSEDLKGHPPPASLGGGHITQGHAGAGPRILQTSRVGCFFFLSGLASADGGR